MSSYKSPAKPVEREIEVTVTLDRPIKIRGELVSEIDLTFPTAGDMRVIQDLPKHKWPFKLVERLGALTPAEVDLIRTDDFAKLEAVIGGFFPKTDPETSPTDGEDS